MQAAVAGLRLPQDLDDVRVPRPGLQDRLGRRPRRDLQHHQAIIQVRLLGEEHPRQAASAQLAQEAVRPDLVARAGQRNASGLGPRLEDRVAQGPVEPEQARQRSDATEANRAR